MPAKLSLYILYIKIFFKKFKKVFLFQIYNISLWQQKQNIMTNERAIEILTDYQAWLSDGQPLHWSASEIGLAIHFAKLEVNSILAATILQDYRNWLEFGQPFYHTLDNLIDSLNIAIETLKTNQ